MAWIESHQTLREHPKTYALMEALGLNKARAIGHLHLLWWWCIDYAPDGLFPADAAKKIARAAEYLGDAGKFVEAMVQAGFLEVSQGGGEGGEGRGGYRVHDWGTYTLSYHASLERADRKRDQTRERVAAFRRKKVVGNASVTQSNADTVPTIPTIPTIPTVIQTKSVSAQAADAPPFYPDGGDTGIPPASDTQPEKGVTQSIHSASQDAQAPQGQAKEGGAATEIPQNARKPDLGHSKRFVKPTPQEVEAYAAEIGFRRPNLGPAFCDFYEAGGWKIGPRPMKDWRAAVRTWKHRDESGGGQRGANVDPKKRITGTAGYQPGKYAGL